MQLLQPELQALQAKYKGKKDPESRQRMNEEMMALYRKHGTNPMASCLPILVQMPIFFALFRVLASLGAVAAGKYGRPSIGPLTQQLAEQVQASSVFGASLSSSFLGSGSGLAFLFTAGGGKRRCHSPPPRLVPPRHCIGTNGVPSMGGVPSIPTPQ